MKRIVQVVVCMVVLALPVLAGAKSARLTEVKPESKDKYEVVYMWLTRGTYAFRYIVDPTTCNCFAEMAGGGATTVECKKLMKMSELAPYVKHCR